ncbi:peptidoglycan glycosyltransferase [Sporosarcina sp. PTS2304]|uniref:transglycosylase domain-containing protein n=1 Tax=Sporosarcina sp. PTS2304 TaxID=2283194 RepID=UPI000E0CC40D|nr:transglycosylase domain-containing protein [Sporosarcina sp. PTS2304]AXH99481.1 peptidoglycan glycosyltransferase [Sporosarcina sp. PTS2304]
MRKSKNNKIQQLENSFEKVKKEPWAKKLRISSGVLWNLFILMLIFSVIGAVFASSVGAGYFASLVAKEPLRTKDELRNAVFNYEETSEMFFANNVYLGKINSDIERRQITLDKVSQYALDAVLATEDEYFNEHEGIVPKAIFRGVFQDLTNSDSQTGGSTLTQQLVKNQILTNEVSYERKAKEILLAMRLEHFMTKDEILEAYLNIIPYGRDITGQNIAGIETAARGIFGIKAIDLNLPQAAYIAGIPQAPYTYTPFYSKNQGIKEREKLQHGVNRMKTVLFRMRDTGYITEAEYQEAIAYDVTKDFRQPSRRATERYPYVTQEIQNRTIEILAKVLAEKDGLDATRFEEDSKVKEKYEIMADRSMRTDGYRIYSTIDKDLYDQMNEVAKNFKYYGFTYTSEKVDEESGKKTIIEDPVQVGATLIENHTGKVLSFIGGRGHEIEAMNHSTQAFRHNGSSMKPLLVYAPAIEYGVIGAGSPVVDVKFRQGSYRPGNYFDRELGILSARESLARSQNLSTLRLYDQIIDRKPIEFLKKMHFTKLTEADGQYLTTALGSMDIGVSVEENTNAFATFANDGKFIKSYMIDRIEDMKGNIIYEHKIEPVDVFSPETAYIITDMMRDVLRPPGTAARLPGFMNFRPDLAAKTGTSQHYGNAWLVGYNPNVSLGVWLGYKNQQTPLYSGYRSSQMHPSERTARLFGQLMNTANSLRPETVKAAERFKRPNGVVTRSFCGVSGMAPSAACSAAGLVRSDLFNSKVMVPTKVDDSIINTASVRVNGKLYQALPSTPREFVSSGGVGVNSQFVKRMMGRLGGDGSKLLAGQGGYSSNVVSGASFPANNVPPAPVQAGKNGATLTWTASSSNDVIGYYIYQNGVRIGTVRDGASRSYTIGYGSYYVRAVDITGLQSAASNTITNAAPVKPKPDTTTPNKKPANSTDTKNPDTTPETKPDAKPDTKPEAKPETDAKPEATPDVESPKKE